MSARNFHAMACRRESLPQAQEHNGDNQLGYLRDWIAQQVREDLADPVRVDRRHRSRVTVMLHESAQLWLSGMTIGELRRGVDLIRHRGDDTQADRLESWLGALVKEYHDSILPFDLDAAQVWGRLRVPHPEISLDKQIAATALLHDLTVVTRNVDDFAGTGGRLLNPFASDG